MNTVLHNYQTCFPIETIKLKYTNRNPWITQEIKNGIKIIIKKHQSRYKNNNLSKQRKAERDYYREQFEIHQHDLKKSWRVIKNIIGKDDKYTPKNNPYF